MLVKLLCAAGLLGLIRCWDVAVTTTDRQLHYYDENGSQISVSNFEGTELSALTYDAATDLLLLIDELNLNDTIFQILSTSDNDTQPLVRKHNIKGMAFDPVNDTLFWIADSDIKSMKLSDPFSNGYGETIVAGSNSTGAYTSIVVDSCGGYIYWAECNLKNSAIRRARFDGSEQTVIVDSGLYCPTSLAIDHSSRRLYWVDDSEGIFFKIESCDLDGDHTPVILIKDEYHKPNHIAVGDRFVYWSDELKQGVWKALKNVSDNSYTNFVDYRTTGARPKGLAVKYNLSDHIEDGKYCAQNKRAADREQKNISRIISENLKMRNDICMHGLPMQLPQGNSCVCVMGYVGVRCEKRPCELCKLGLCDKEELSNCYGTSVSSPAPSPVNETNTTGDLAHKTAKQATSTRSVVPVTTEHAWNASEQTFGATDDVFFERPSCSEDTVKDFVIMSLGALCGLLCIAVAVLVMKVMQLKKRPRIKKRIIVNKTVTPLTARPEQQCEITIENCCNMNICETPCFEPRSTIRPTLIGAKAVKEEKQNLIDSMADDY